MLATNVNVADIGARAVAEERPTFIENGVIAAVGANVCAGRSPLGTLEGANRGSGPMWPEYLSRDLM